MKLFTERTLILILAVILTILSGFLVVWEFNKIEFTLTSITMGILGTIIGIALGIFTPTVLYKKNKGKVFLSYSNNDVDFAKKLSHDLNMEGFEIMDHEKIVMVGDSISDNIEKGIQQADCLIVLISGKTKMSSLISSEIEIAKDKKKRIYPVLIDQVYLPKTISNIQFADFTQKYEVGLTALIKSLRAGKQSLEEK